MQKSSLKVSREKNVLLNPSSTNISLLYPLKTSENLRFSVLGGIKAEQCENELMFVSLNPIKTEREKRF